MAGAGPLNAQEVAQRAGCAERSVRKWLNSQAAGGYVQHHATSETDELSPEQAVVLADEDSPLFLPPAWSVPASLWFDEDKVPQAFFSDRSRPGLARSPRAAAQHAADALTEDGTVMLVEPFAHDRVEDNLHPIGRLYYAASATICCAHSLSEDDRMALEAQAEEARLNAVFQKAGFRTFRRATQTPFSMVLEAKL